MSRAINRAIKAATAVAVSAAIGYTLLLFISGVTELKARDTDTGDPGPAPALETEYAEKQAEPEAEETIYPVELAQELQIEPEAETVPWTDADVEMLAKLMWAEAGGIHDTKQQAAIAWCVLNRLDAGGFGDTIAEVITAPEQFAYTPETAATASMLELAEDVLQRWYAEKQGADDVGRTLPAEYLYFDGDGITNHFHTDWQSETDWDWSLPDPYGG